MFKKIVLPNKLRAIIAPMKGTNTVTVLVMCATGSDHEPKEKIGISHFLEHMFFKGTAKRGTPQAIFQELDSMGSVSNAFTTHEYTGYYIKAGKVYLRQALDLLADIYQNSLLKEEEVEREKQVIIEELQKDRDMPSLYIWWLWEQLLYGNQHAGWDIIGTEKKIRSFLRDDLVNYFSHQYTAENTIIIVAGNFDETKTIQRVKQLFGHVRQFKPRAKARFSEKQKAPAVMIKTKSTDQTHMMLGFRALPAGHKDRFALDVLETILGASWSSRMFDALREKWGLAYNVYSSAHAYTNRGYFLTYAGVSHANAEKALAVMLEEYKKITEVKVSHDELKRAKDHLKGTSLIELESSNAVAHFIGGQEVLLEKPLTIDEVFAKIDAVSTREIRILAKKLFTRAHLNLALIGPTKDKAKFLKLLKGY